MASMANELAKQLAAKVASKSESEDSGSEGLEAAFEELKTAMSGGNASQGIEALRSFVEMCK